MILQAVFVGGTFGGHKTLTTESLLMSGWGQGHEPSEKETLAHVSSAGSKQKWK